MTGRWLLSTELARVLPPAALAQLDDVDPTAALTCQVCGNVKAHGDRSPMAVIAAHQPDGNLVLGFAHPRCRDRVGDIWPGLLDRVADADEGIDALAFFALRDAPAPRALLAFEPQAFVRLVPHEGDGADAYVQAMIALGFTLARSPVAELSPPPAHGWAVTAHDAQLTLSHSFAGIGYTQSVTPEVQHWLSVASAEGQCLVVTGTSLGIDPAQGVPADFPWARARGLLVAAVVAVRSPRTGTSQHSTA